MRGFYSSSISLLIKIFCIVFFAFSFLVVYNKFLIDDSLRSLEVSLDRYNEGEIIGVKDVLKSVIVETALADDTKELAQLEYVNNILDDPKASDEVQVFLSAVVREKKRERGLVLNTLDKVVSKFNDFTNVALSFGKRDSLIELEKNFKEAKSFYDNRDFSQAQKLFLDIKRKGQGTSYSELSSVYLKLIESNLKKAKEIDSLLDKLKVLSDAEEISNVYYKIAALYMEIGQYDKAEAYFEKVVTDSRQEDILKKAHFNLGFAKKIQGKIDEAKDVFESLTKEFTDPEALVKTKIQIADIFKKQNKSAEAVNIYSSLIENVGDTSLAGVVLFAESSSLSLDMNNTEESEKLLTVLFRDYPASDIVEEAKKIMEFSNLQSLEKPLSFRDRIMLTAFNRIPTLRLVLNVVETGAVYFALYMIEGSIKQALLQQKEKGDILVIERTDEFLTNWVNERLEIIPESIGNFRVSIENFNIDFPRDGWVEIKTTGYLGTRQFEGYALGQMYLKKILDPYSMWEEEDTPQVWVVFEIKEARIAGYNIPLVIANEMLNKAETTFNKKQIFKQEELQITPTMGVWAGEVKYDQRTLEKKLEQIEALKKGLIVMGGLER